MGRLQKLDNRIQLMLQVGIKDRVRTVFVMIGNKGQDQVPIMHQIMNTLCNKGKLSILWCYKKELSFSTHRKKNLKLLNKKRKAGLTSDATIFEQFICTTDIRWSYYHETHKILGQTFDMCILQDFEALTPNTLARTIETVSGGGLIVFLLKSMDSLKQLTTMAMDVHARYRTDAHQDVVCRFNERFLLSLASNSRCLVLDDRWRILPLSKSVLTSLQASAIKDSKSVTTSQDELQKLKVALTEDGSPFAPLVKICVTMDQARGLVQFCASLASSVQSFSAPGQDAKSQLSQGVAQSLLGSIGSSQPNAGAASAIAVMTAGRGRGKSAALGLALAAAIEAGLPNIYVTAPSPENLTTLMQFVVRGLVAFAYEEHQDYVVSRTTDPDYNQAVVRIDVHRQTHRQSLVYLSPWELASYLSRGGQQADLVCVDEAAAIPLALVRHFIEGPRLVFMASTINGYEGTGRSLSLKLIKQLRNECKIAEASVRLNPKLVLPNVEPKSHISEKKLGRGFRSADTSRVLYEITLDDAIRYANGDPVEAWLTELLCLDCGSSLLRENPSLTGAYYPPLDRCQLYFVNRDTLFAYHKSTEVFLHRLMALYVASHYKNSPNDLQLLSDAPAHHIFCLLAPYQPESGRVPEILCVLQVCLEGKINKERVLRSLSRGVRPSGDLIPWTVAQQFCDAQFGELSGARVVRIATHPDYQNLGYGTRALQLLHDYYAGKVPVQSSDKGVVSEPHSETSYQSNGAKERKIKTSAPAELSDDNGASDDDDDKEELIEQSDQYMQSDENLNKDEQNAGDGDSQSNLLTEKFERRGPSSLPPLLSRLCERQPERLHYVGVSFGATPDLLRFWKRVGYVPVYLRQTLNELTGEFTCIMLKQFEEQAEHTMNSAWLLQYYQDFKRRFMYLLPGCFRYMDAAYALELFHNKSAQKLKVNELTQKEAQTLFSPVDLERLRRYTRSLVDFHVISDLLPNVARLFFDNRLPEVRLNKTQQVILLGLGLQHKTVERLSSEFTRLLGDSNSTNRTVHEREAADASAIMARLEDSNTRDCCSSISGGLSSSLRPKTAESSTTNSGTGWARRIRGLLFVIVRELAGKSLSLRLDALEDDDDDELVVEDINDNADTAEEKEDNEDDDTEAHREENETMEGEALSETEVKRRADIVRQVLSEELSAGGGPLGALSSYKVHGSESEWAKAIVGHGSDLSSLRVQLPKSSNANERILH
ncbi:N-acetyltransferase 10 protein [Fasciola gigantica]|uniref:RNA cytidine acetyltransferase n=1 Tax=Fasciola gigantica TaxID=46835 RepID=A0A504Z718_FASGI|nr:N-acetyltransferase 10 protein [Fasciola gigantica]